MPDKDGLHLASGEGIVPLSASSHHLLPTGHARKGLRWGYVFSTRSVANEVFSGLASTLIHASVITMLLTIRLRLKDKHASELNRQAAIVNFVWNYCNETQTKAAKAGRRWLSGYDLIKLTSGSSKLLNVHAHTIQRVCKQYAESRQKANKPWLGFRGQKSLGWVPFNTAPSGVSFNGDAFIFRGRKYVAMHRRDIPVGPLKAGSFNRDSRGRWYINFAIDVNPISGGRTNAVGIDLGLVSLASLSDGGKIGFPRYFSRHQDCLARAKRANKYRLMRTIEVRIANSRRDYLHKQTSQLARNYGILIAGNVSGKNIAKARFGKSLADASWHTLRSMLSYKSIRNGGIYIEVSEYLTSRTCSNCGAVGGLAGIAGLGIREWTCVACGCHHDRDVNAARNILARGLASLAEGAAQAAEQPK